jgi:hypothetical protein
MKGRGEATSGGEPCVVEGVIQSTNRGLPTKVQELSPNPKKVFQYLGRKNCNFGVGLVLFDRHVCVSVELNESFIQQEMKIGM